MAFEDFPEQIRSLADREYVALLLRSLESRIVEGATFPGFPKELIQSNFVGSSGKQALEEAEVFWTFLKAAAADLGRPMRRSSNVLDFGCGWGRFLRFLAKDVDASHLYGVDVDPEVLAECRAVDVPGHLRSIAPLGPLPFPDRVFDVVMAYSVFTHLPADVHLHWMREIARTSEPGAVFVLTLQPRVFLEFVRNEAFLGTSPWHRNLARFAGYADDLVQRFDRGEFVYLASGGGAHRPEETYGEAVVPENWIRREWGSLWHVCEIVSDRSRFAQDVLVAQRLPNSNRPWWSPARWLAMKPRVRKGLNEN
jgi:SAM-dependent methyltransferase